MGTPRMSSVGPKRFSKHLFRFKTRRTNDSARDDSQKELQLAPITSGKYLDWAIVEPRVEPPFWKVSHRKSSSNLITAREFLGQSYDEFSDDEYNDDLDYLEDEELDDQHIKEGGSKDTKGMDINVPYTLVSFGLRGDAELIRLLFIMTGTPYEERQIVEEEEKLQVLDSTPYNSLPVLTRGDQIWGNTEAIVRTLARKFYLLGQTNHEHLIVEAMFERMCQLKRNHTQVVQSLHLEIKSKEKMEWMYHQLRYVILPPALTEWEKLILSSKGPFIVQSGITLADLAIMDFLDQCSLKIHLEDVLRDFDGLADLVMLVKGHQRIANYLDDRSELEWNI